MSRSTNNPVLNTVLGIIALVFIAFFLNWLVSLSTWGSKTLDLTEAKVHTLTEGTEAILKDLKTSEAEVVVNYYATREAEAMPRELKLYMKKVDDFLKRYQSIAGDNLRIVNLDPEPDTDAEDSANLDGIAGQSINGENLYLGISVSSLDRKATIPFLSPAGETQLEYQLSSAIAQVSRTDQAKLGLMSALPLAGAAPQMQMPGMPPQRQSNPFLIYQQLQQLYEVTDLGMTPTAADLDGLSAVLLIHPAGISEETEYVLDQYLLAGGTVVATLDAFSITAQQSGGGNPMMGQQGIAASASFSESLLDSWGVTFESNEVIADGKYRTRMQNGESTSVLSLTKEAMPLKDSIITSELNDIFFILSGGFQTNPKEGLSYRTLLRTSNQAGLVNADRAARLDPTLIGAIKPADKPFDLALHISGNFKSAFPDGNPATSSDEEDSAEEEEEESKETTGLTESTEPGNLFLIADTDFLADTFAYQVNMFGMPVPQGDNAALLINILDQVTGSKYLIGSRSRGDSRRPFSVIQEMESEFEQKFGEKLEKEQAELDKLSENINELIRKQESEGQAILEGDLAEEISRATEKQVEARKRLRELEKELRSDKDALASKYTRANLFIIPSLVVLIGITVLIKRRSATSAR